MRRARDGGGTRDARRWDGRRRMDAREDAGGVERAGRAAGRARGRAWEVSSVRGGRAEGEARREGVEARRARDSNARRAKGLNARAGTVA